MIELFPNISERTRTNAERAWRLAQIFHNPLTLTNFLNEYTIAAPSEEEQDFLRFYFNLQMELLKDE